MIYVKFTRQELVHISENCPGIFSLIAQNLGCSHEQLKQLIENGLLFIEIDNFHWIRGIQS